LLNDACVKHKKALVSGSALGLEGQVTVYNSTVKKDGAAVKGPCYRCLFPTPPPPNSSNSCSQAGVLGAGNNLKKIRELLICFSFLSAWTDWTHSKH